jgi:hypothetical protein
MTMTFPRALLLLLIGWLGLLALVSGCSLIQDTATGEYTPEVAQKSLDDLVEAVPGVAGQGLALAGGLAILVWREVRNHRTKKVAAAKARKAGAAMIVQAIDSAKSVDGVVNFADPATKTRLDANLGVEGRALVDEAQGGAVVDVG